MDGDDKVVRRQKKNTRPIGPRSKINTIRSLDGRRREAKRLRAIENDLAVFAANGTGRISIGQKILCERLAVDIWRLEAMDSAFAAGTISDSSAKIAHALRNSVRLGLRDLRRAEFRAAPPPKPDDDYDDLARLVAALR